MDTSSSFLLIPTQMTTLPSYLQPSSAGFPFHIESGFKGEVLPSASVSKPSHWAVTLWSHWPRFIMTSWLMGSVFCQGIALPGPSTDCLHW